MGDKIQRGDKLIVYFTSMRESMKCRYASEKWQTGEYMGVITPGTEEQPGILMHLRRDGIEAIYNVSLNERLLEEYRKGGGRNE